jgi:hypothetical protein
MGFISELMKALPKKEIEVHLQHNARFIINENVK